MRKALILIAVVALAAIACIALVPVNITGADNGKTIDVLRFRTIKLSLEANPTTGYTWQLTSPTNREVLRQYYYKYKRMPTKLVGVGGHDIWKFWAIRPGTETVKAVYLRPWEGSTPPAKTFTVTIRVK